MAKETERRPMCRNVRYVTLLQHFSIIIPKTPTRSFDWHSLFT